MRPSSWGKLETKFYRRLFQPTCRRSIHKWGTLNLAVETVFCSTDMLFLVLSILNIRFWGNQPSVKGTNCVFVVTVQMSELHYSWLNKYDDPYQFPLISDVWAQLVNIFMVWHYARLAGARTKGKYQENACALNRHARACAAIGTIMGFPCTG